MYGNGLFTPDEVAEFIGKHKYAILAFARHDTITLNNYLSTTDALIRYTIDNNTEGREYACQRFSTRNVEPPKDELVKYKKTRAPDVSGPDATNENWIPDMGVMFYRDGKCLACMNSCDMHEFETLFKQLPTIEEEKPKPPAKDPAPQPVRQNPPQSSECCIIL